MSNRFIAVQPGTDSSQQLAVINKNFAELDNESVKKLFYDSNGVPSIQIGVQQDGTSRIRVAKSGVDVTTATDAQLAFNSAQNTLKVVAKGTTTMPRFNIGSGQPNYTLLTIPHGLSFAPLAQIYVGASLLSFATSSLIASTYVQLPVIPSGVNSYWFNTVGGSSYTLTIMYAIDATNIYIQASSSYTGAADTVLNIPVTYLLLQESAA